MTKRDSSPSTEDSLKELQEAFARVGHTFAEVLSALARGVSQGLEEARAASAPAGRREPRVGDLVSGVDVADRPVYGELTLCSGDYSHGYVDTGSYDTLCRMRDLEVVEPLSEPHE